MATGSRTQWALWRQDDNGSSSIIDRFTDQSEANAKLQELEARGHKQHYWIECEQTPSSPRLNLVVLRAANLELSRSFYETIGLTFASHRHGNGSEHYASESTWGVFEIYPLKIGQPNSLGTRVGFAVGNIEETIENLRNEGHTIKQEIADSPWGKRAVVIDPDGHAVELIREPL